MKYLLEDERPNLWIDWIEVEGPLERPPAPLSAEKLFDGDSTNLSDDEVRPILEQFAHEAFRRAEPDPEYIDRLMHVYHQAQGHGAEVNVALKDAMAVVLASPRFLFLYEPQTESDQPRPLTDRELAVRLAYFFWSAPPTKSSMNWPRRAGSATRRCSPRRSTA